MYDVSVGGLTVFVVSLDTLTETEPTHSPNVDTGTVIVPTLRNRTAKEWFEFAFQLPPPVLNGYSAFPVLF